jgi:hypothetical protein
LELDILVYLVFEFLICILFVFHADMGCTMYDVRCKMYVNGKDKG